MIKAFNKLFKQQPPPRRPSPLLEEMQTINANLQAIQGLLAAQKPPTVTVNMPAATAASTSDFEPFEPFDTSAGEDSGNE